LFLGKIIAYAGMLEGKEVTWFPSYGAEVRGGTANCTVIISDELIGSPVVTHPDILIVMSDASLNKFLPKLKHNGLFLYDSSLIKNYVTRDDIEIVDVPATEIANKIGNTKSANMVLLGALIAKTGLLKRISVLEAVESSMPERKKKIIENNKKAIIEGIGYIENKKS
jgi:2-oxoglutarate ferredoxin oxidoreductase subunit gamma